MTQTEARKKAEEIVEDVIPIRLYLKPIQKPNLTATEVGLNVEKERLRKYGKLKRDKLIRLIEDALQQERGEVLEEAAKVVEELEVTLPDKVRNAQYIRGSVASAIRRLKEAT